MKSIHGHEVMQMMIDSGESYTKDSLEKAIHAKFGQDARFFTCSAENLTAIELIAFLEERGKFVSAADGFQTSQDKMCSH